VIEEGQVAQVLLQVSVAIQVHKVDLGNRKPFAAKVPAEFDEGFVFFPVLVDGPDDHCLFPGDPVILAGGA